MRLTASRYELWQQVPTVPRFPEKYKFSIKILIAKFMG